MIYSTSKPVVD